MTPRKKRALAALLNSPTRATAAEAAGVGLSTLREWLRTDEEFKAEFQRVTSELLADATVQSKRNLTRAFSVLADVMEHSENDAVRVQAARASIEYSLRLHEATDAAERMEKIEEMLEKVKDH